MLCFSFICVCWIRPFPQWIPQTRMTVHFHLHVLLHPRLFCNKHMQICYERNTCFLRNGQLCWTLSFKVNQNKNSQIKSLFFQVGKFLSHIPVTCKSLCILQIHQRLIFILVRHTHCCQFWIFFFKCKFSLVTTVLSKREILLVLKTTTLLPHCKLAVFVNHTTEIINMALLSFLLFLLK